MESINLKEGEVVWTKLKGFPWWPGIINKILPTISPSSERRVTIQFFGDHSFSTTSIKNIKPFEKYLTEFRNSKKKNLVNAIENAIEFINCRKGKKIQNKKNRIRTKYHLIGNKHKRNADSKEFIWISKDLSDIINEFIYNKRKMENEDYDKIFDSLNNLINEANLNINQLHSVIKLFRFITCSRNINNSNLNNKTLDILKLGIQKKIFETLFDEKYLTINDQEKELNFSPKELLEEINSLNSENYQEIENKSSKSNVESTINLSSGSKSDYEEIKSKIVVTPMDNNNLFKILTYFDSNICNKSINNINNNITINDLNNKENNIINNINDIDNHLEDKIHNIINKIISNNPITNKNNIKNIYLRKRTCLKLYNIFNILFKCINLKEEIIKNIILIIESKARTVDETMSEEYKKYISQIFKRIKEYFI